MKPTHDSLMFTVTPSFVLTLPINKFIYKRVRKAIVIT